MPILKNGLLIKNKFLFESTEKNYFVSLCNGTWSPTATSSELIFDSESTPTRFLPTIATGWKESVNSDYVNIDFEVNYTEDILYNRIVLYYGGYQRSLLDVAFNGLNSLTIVSPEHNDFSIGDRILHNRNFYEITEINGFDLGVLPQDTSPNLPNTGDGQIRDASGIPIVASVLNDVYLITNGTTVNFSLTGSSA